MNIEKALNLSAVERFETEFEGQKFWFEAKKESLTPRFIELIDSTVTYPKILSEVLTDWSVTAGEDDAPKWELDALSLSKLPTRFLLHIINTIAKSWAGDRPKANGSASGSAAAA